MEPLVAAEEDGVVRASKPVAGMGFRHGWEPGLLQNGQIRDAKSIQLLQPRQLRALPACFFLGAS